MAVVFWSSMSSTNIFWFSLWHKTMYMIRFETHKYMKIIFWTWWSPYKLFLWLCIWNPKSFEGLNKCYAFPLSATYFKCFPVSPFPSNPFLVDNWFLAYINPNNSFIRDQITINLKPTWISTHKLMAGAIWRQLEFVQKCQSGKCSCICCVGSPCEGVDSNQCFAWTSKMYILIKVTFFLTFM